MTPDEEKNMMNAYREAEHLRFWLLGALSLLFIMTFVYYLPLRFREQVTDDHNHAHDAMMSDDSANHEHENTMMVDNEMMMEGIHEKDGHTDHGTTLYHEEKDVRNGLVVNLNTSPEPIGTGTSTQLNFFVNTKPNTIPVSMADLQIEHEKIMHVIGIRSDMNEFFHIHPENDYAVTYGAGNPALWVTKYNFLKPGSYKIWSEIKKDGVVHSFGHEPIMVEGAGPREEKKVSFGRSVVVGGYQVVLLLEESLGKNVEYDISFDIHDENGNEIEVENYLGAAMHLSIIKDDWTEFTHIHPEGAHTHAGFQFINKALAHGGVVDEHNAEENDETINFHATFPKAGLYRAFAQFRPAGSNLPADEALTAAFWIRVEEKAVPPPVSPAVSARQSWWGLLAVSSILVIILGIVVKKYVRNE